MAENKEQFSEDEPIYIESEEEEVLDDKPEQTRKIEQEDPENKEQEIRELKEAIERVAEKDQPTPELPEDAQQRAEKIKAYQDKYLPDHLREKGASIISKAITYLWTRGAKFEKEGKENIPDKGPFIVIGNHFGGGDAEAILDTFQGTNIHFGIAKEMWWNTPARWLLKKFGMIPIEESLSNIPEEEKEEALKRQGGHGKDVFRRIIDREKTGGVAMNTEFVRQAVAVLSRGDTVGVYPEGLWLNPEGPMKLREKAEMKKGYQGIELVARQYQKLTGEELPIVPTAFIEDRKTGKKKVVVGKPLLLSENDSGMSGTDWCMAHVAEMLPEEQRGYYKDKVEKK